MIKLDVSQDCTYMTLEFSSKTFKTRYPKKKKEIFYKLGQCPSSQLLKRKHTHTHRDMHINRRRTQQTKSKAT